MEQKKWIPAPNVKQNAERHCGNCGRSIKHQKRDGDDKVYACSPIVIKGKDFDTVISTCSGQSYKYKKGIIRV